MTAICAVLGIARRSAYYVARARADGRHHRATDDTVLQQIRAVTNSRATYGYRRVWAMVNRTFRAGYNRKRIRRVMQLHGLMLPPRVHRRHGRPHLGTIQQAASNQSRGPRLRAVLRSCTGREQSGPEHLGGRGRFV